VKSLLLGSAAGLVAIAGAQAADLPVKAKPVQYVKICSLYGVGFYYIPGTDMCLKVGGWLRWQTHYNVNGNSTNGPLVGNVNNRTTNDFTFRARGYITADARNQTAYGTVRSYLDVGFSTDDYTAAGGVAPALSVNRAFIQWAGFTFGLAQSFYDFYSQPAVQYFGWGGASDTGDGGQFVYGYTAQFGNGWSATIAAEAARRSDLINVNNTGTIPANTISGTLLTNSYAGANTMDPVANIRLDQTWGAFQVMGALHQVTGTYYGTTEWTGHPGDKWGYAVGVGLKLNAPMVGPGDYFQAQFNYTEGAAKYVANTPAGTAMSAYQGQNVGWGIYSDGVYSNNAAGNIAATIQLTTTWGVNASYEHFWNTQWRTSLWGAYNETDYNSTANAALCGGNTGLVNGSLGVTYNSGVGSCNQDFKVYAVGTRTQWNVTPDFYMGVEVVYTKLDQNQVGTVVLPAVGTKPAGTYITSDMDAWGGYFRVHKDFYP